MREDIAAGHQVAGGRLPSEPQLVKRFGVSRPTIARALLDLQNEGLIERRAGAGTYVRAPGTSSGAGSTRQLGLLIPGLDTTETFQLVCGSSIRLCRCGTSR